MWSGDLELSKLTELIIASWMGKVIIAVLLTPLIYTGHALVQRVLGIAPLLPDSEAQ